MYNYYEFNYDENKESFEYFNSLSTSVLKNILNKNFNYIEINLINYANVFKKIFESNDYDEFYYSCLSLIEDLNDIKIIINILREKDRNE